MEKVIHVDDKAIKVKCTAATYIKYRKEFTEDLFTSLQDISKGMGEDGAIPPGAVATMLQAMYIMAKQADPSIKASFEDWIDQFSLLSPLTGATELFNMLMADQNTLEEEKKSSNQLSEE